MGLKRNYAGLLEGLGLVQGECLVILQELMGCCGERSKSVEAHGATMAMKLKTHCTVFRDGLVS